MNCPKCGTPSIGEEPFCRQCGTELVREAAAAHESAAAVEAAPSYDVAQPQQAGGDMILEIAAGPGAGRSFLLDEINRIGRGADNKVRLFDPEVSRQHAAIYRYEQGYAINDLGSANGTFVNGNRISEATWLLPGDRIQVGSVLMHAIVPGMTVSRTPDRARPAAAPAPSAGAGQIATKFPAAPRGLPVILLGGLMVLGVLLAAGGVVGLIILFL